MELYPVYSVQLCVHLYCKTYLCTPLHIWYPTLCTSLLEPYPLRAPLLESYYVYTYTGTLPCVHLKWSPSLRTPLGTLGICTHLEQSSCEHCPTFEEALWQDRKSF